jgi:D-alanyl-lipoteichoic acid acyltransferase DltB (MBOAT superfamily)
MYFNSYVFIFAFLPLVWLGWRLSIKGFGLKTGIGWLSLSSLFFYSWWDWRFAPLLVGSLLVNFFIGRRLSRRPDGARLAWIAVGLVWNLGLLGYFKYWNFFAGNFNALTGAGLPLGNIILPLGISFFTFQKIAFLVDAYKGRVKEVRLLDFSLFVMFFPQLIAGPIVHHGDFIPQLREQYLARLDQRKLTLGVMVFSAGLFQKCFVADMLSTVANETFGLAAQGAHLRMVEAWAGMFAYTLQLFYDFSGYSHMAIGLALMFGLRLPINFLAPYSSRNMIEFWRRWHMTLSSFLRDYVYIPLGGNRNRHLTNLFITMLLAGLWHGAGWTFILWGVWHGLALVVNHWWHGRNAGKVPQVPEKTSGFGWSHILTLIVIAYGWVLFRSPDLATAWQMTQCLAGWHGISVPVSWVDWVAPLAPVVRPRGFFPNINLSFTVLIVFLSSAFLSCRGPRLLKWLGVGPGDVTAPPAWQQAELAAEGSDFRPGRVVLAGIMFAVAVATLANASPFLYFQF